MQKFFNKSIFQKILQNITGVGVFFIKSSQHKFLQTLVQIILHKVKYLGSLAYKVFLEILVKKFLLENFVYKVPFLKRILDNVTKALIPLKDFLDRILEKTIFKFIPRNYVWFLFVSLIASLGILYFMAVLISGGENLKPTGDQNVSIEFLLDEQLEDLELRSRRLPKKPEQEEPPPETPKLKIQQAELEKPQLSSNLPQLELPEDFQSDAQGTGVANQGIRDSSVTPIFRINPIYPRKAALQNIEGFVVLSFDITEVGQVDNVSVIKASPPQIFNSNAVRALSKWKYKPKIENGKAVRQKNLKVQLDFRLTN